MTCVNALFCVYIEMIYMHSATLFNWHWGIARLIDANTIMLFYMFYAFFNEYDFIIINSIKMIE